MPATEITLAEFIASLNITADVESAPSNPNTSGQWGRDARHFVVTLRRPDVDPFPVPFSQGSGIHEDPTAADVLDCLASDASSIADEPDWLEWAKNMGATSIDDAEDARRTFAAIEKQTEQLRAFLGDGFDVLLYGTERL